MQDPSRFAAARSVDFSYLVSDSLSDPINCCDNFYSCISTWTGWLKDLWEFLCVFGDSDETQDWA